MTEVEASVAVPVLPVRFHHRVRHLFRHHVDYRRRSALLMWLAFALTFGGSRLLTLAIHEQWLPNTNVVTKGGLHIHHFVWGIALLLLVGFLSITLENVRWHPLLAVLFGVGAALVIDEFALWLNLKDVYWQQQGQLSVELAGIAFALLGGYYAADRFWRALSHEIASLLRSLRERHPTV